MVKLCSQNKQYWYTKNSMTIYLSEEEEEEEEEEEDLDDR